MRQVIEIPAIWRDEVKICQASRGPRAKLRGAWASVSPPGALRVNAKRVVAMRDINGWPSDGVREVRILGDAFKEEAGPDEGGLHMKYEGALRLWIGKT